MKQWFKELIKASWKYGLLGIICQAGQVASIMLHKYILASVFSFGVIVCIGIWGPYVEENFKRSHCSTISEALRFAWVESLIYLPSAFFLGVNYLSARLPMLVMHSASAMCYHNHRTSNGVFYFWLICHSTWNIMAQIRPEFMYTMVKTTLIPTYFTIGVVVIWGFSLYRKIKEAKA